MLRFRRQLGRHREKAGVKTLVLSHGSITVEVSKIDEIGGSVKKKCRRKEPCSEGDFPLQ